MSDDGIEISEGERFSVKHKSLLAKYEIPIDHLSYEYIRGCNNAKEIERIVKILRSGEEGHFPDLQKTAEERLGQLSPHSRQLRTEVPALDRSCFSKQEWRDILGDMASWRREVSSRDQQLCACDDSAEAPQTSLPPVRQHLPPKQPPGRPADQPRAKKKVGDYAFWDKYDVDTELLKMDLEEQRKKVEGQQTTKQRTETDRLKLVVKEAKKCSETERKILAEQEKVRGNEYHQAKDYKEAEKYYTASLTIYPTAKAYNNRASCYLKQDKFSDAIRDADRSLELEPNNVKALYRKGIALKNMNENEEALKNINAVLRQEPNQVQAQTIAKQIIDKINSEKKNPGHMQKCDKFESKNLPLFDSKISELKCFEVNEWGLPKKLCRCFGSLWVKVAQEEANSQNSLFPVLNHPNENKKTESIRIVEISDEKEEPKRKHPTKLEIIEIDSPHHEPLNDYCKPTKCNVVDKRSQKTSVEHGGGDVL